MAYTSNYFKNGKKSSGGNSTASSLNNSFQSNYFRSEGYKDAAGASKVEFTPAPKRTLTYADRQKILTDAVAESFEQGLKTPQNTVDYLKTGPISLPKQEQQSSENLSQLKAEQKDLKAQKEKLEQSKYGTLPTDRTYSVRAEQGNTKENQAREEVSKKLAAVEREIQRLEYLNKHSDKKFDDDFAGQFGANYNLGRIAQDTAAAYNEYLQNPTAENKKYAESLAKLMQEFQTNNQYALDDNGAVLPLITQSAAGYIPQLIDQTKAQVGGGLVGAAGGAVVGSAIPGAGTVVGAIKGAKAGAIAGSGVYSYNQMRGAAFQELLAAGLDEKTARAAANDEALISALIEMADTGFDMATLGTGKLISTLFGESAEKVAKTAAGSAVKKAASAISKYTSKPLVGYALNVGGEMLEEGAQQAVSIANRNRNTQGVFDLAGKATTTAVDALTGKNKEAAAEISEAAKEGGKVAALFGGVTSAATGMANAAIQRKNAKQTAAAQKPELPNVSSTNAPASDFKATVSAPGSGRENILPKQENAAETISKPKAPGFYRNEWFKGTEKEAAYLDRLAKAVGISIEKVSTNQAGNRDGWIVGGKVYLNEQTTDPVKLVAKHEVTHYLQEMAPKAYNAFRSYVENIYKERGTLPQQIDGLISLYRENNQELTAEEALDELAANYAGDLMDNEALIRKLAGENRTLGQKILDAIRDVLRRLRTALSSQEVKQLDRAARLWEQALQETNEAYYQQGKRSGNQQARNMYAGEQSVTADIAALARAKEMDSQSVSAETIRQQTGWFKGMDGKWRYEIDDSAMRYERRGDINFRKRHEGYDRYRELTQKAEDFMLGRSDKWLTTEEQQELTQLQNTWGNTFRTDGRVAPEALPTTKLTDYIDHPELFAAYPRLQDASLVFAELPEGTRGQYDREKNIIRVSQELRHAPQETLLHEIQHAVQQIEGFTGGASVEYWENRQQGGRESAKELYRNTAGEIEARDTGKRKNFTAEERKKTAPDLGGEDVAFADEGGRFLSAAEAEADEEILHLKDQIKANLADLNKMQPVADVKTPAKFPNRLSDRRAWVESKLKTTEVDRQDLGKVNLGTNQIRKGLTYAKDPADVAAFAAVPAVIKRGRRIMGHKNHKGNEVKSVTFAAPVVINGKPGVMGVVVQHTNGNNYKAHKILMPDGTAFVLEENRETEPGPVMAQSETDRLDKRTSSASGNTVPQERDSVKGARELQKKIDQIVQDGKQQGRSEEDINTDIRAAVDEVYQSMLEEYGAIKPGEKPAREVQVPQRTDKDKKVSQTVRTILEAGATPDEIVPDIEKLVATGDFSYDVYTDKAAIADAEQSIRKTGWEKAQRDWFSRMEKGEVSKELTTKGWVLYNNAANIGDTALALDILDAMVKHQRNAAQALQATRILKKLSPETQLYNVQRSVEGLQEELNERYGAENAPTLKVDKDLAEQYLQATTQEERDTVLKEIYRDIGKQMPSRFIDKWNAWRYLAMLGNPRTHVRNVVGNLGFAPVVGVKNMTATAIESAVSRLSGGRISRTKSALNLNAKADRDLLTAAWGDYKNAAEVVGDGKYDELKNTNKYIAEGQTVFKFKPLEAARKANSKALSLEDAWFSQTHYAAALASYCKANGITAAQIESGKGMKEARAYALKEAQKATYQDTNAFSQTVSQLGRSGSKNKNVVGKGLSVLMEGILPFRKTPANILVRGLEYSPAGLLKGLTLDLWRVQNKKITAAEAIDNISAGLTGTGLLAFGVYLAAEGLVRGHGSGDEEEKKFEELMGHQSYALELPNGTSVTLDWLAPEALPFFIGVNLWEQTAKENEELTLSAVLGATETITEPLLEMSCLQSLNAAFDAVGYASSEDLSAIATVIAAAATSYLTQALPTIMGQAERTSETQRMTTYTEKDAFLTKDMQYTLGKASAKIPVLDYKQIPYIDAWGRAESSGNVGTRAANNFLNPAYMSKVGSSAMEDELLRLYEATGEGSVLPERAARYFNVNKQRKDLTGQEYVDYATKKGQTAYNVLSSLVSSEGYRAMTDTQKVDAISSVYSYANAVAKMEVSDYKPDGWVADAVEATKNTGIKPEQYVVAYLLKNSVESLKDAKGETITNSEGLQIMEQLYAMESLTTEQRNGLFEDFKIGKTIRGFSKAKVESELKKMRRQAQ